MIIQIDHTGTHEGLERAINDCLAQDKIKSILILSCDANDFIPEKIDPILKKINIPILGGIFPAVLHGRDKLEKGSLVVGMFQKVNLKVVNGLSDNSIDYVDELDEIITNMKTVQTMFVFVDGFSTRIGAFIDSLFNVFGLENNYIGGGAGSLSMKQKPCLFSQQGLIQDSAILAALDTASGVGVSHGWRSISGPYKVTESEMNTIKTLDWEPAFNVYREVVEKHAKSKIDKNDFFNSAKAYPFGIAKLGTERIVRDPFQVGQNNSLVCVGEVPEGVYVDILHGDALSLIEAAGHALNLSKKNYKGTSHGTSSIFMDCISRVLFLNDQFKDELNAVFDKNLDQIGACTIGEIANSGDDYLEFYNKTSVVAILEDL